MTPLALLLALSASPAAAADDGRTVATADVPLLEEEAAYLKQRRVTRAGLVVGTVGTGATLVGIGLAVRAPACPDTTCEDVLSLTAVLTVIGGILAAEFGAWAALDSADQERRSLRRLEIRVDGQASQVGWGAFGSQLYVPVLPVPIALGAAGVQYGVNERAYLAAKRGPDADAPPEAEAALDDTEEARLDALRPGPTGLVVQPAAGPTGHGWVVGLSGRF